jgi:hypothetical protein
MGQQGMVVTMWDFFYHLPKNVWKTVKMALCLLFIYAMLSSFLLPGIARMIGF